MSTVADITLRVGGESGEGVISVGEMLTLVASRMGNNVYTFRTFPAEIKGGILFGKSKKKTARARETVKIAQASAHAKLDKHYWRKLNDILFEKKASNG